MDGTPELDVVVTFLSAEEGGRVSRVGNVNEFRYRPHFVVTDHADQREDDSPDGEHLGVLFTSGPTCFEPGVPHAVRVAVIYHPGVCYDQLKPGATFAIREGGRTVGHGRVTAREDAA